MANLGKQDVTDSLIYLLRFLQLCLIVQDMPQYMFIFQMRISNWAITTLENMAIGYTVA